MIKLYPNSRLYTLLLLQKLYLYDSIILLRFSLSVFRSNNFWRLLHYTLQHDFYSSSNSGKSNFWVWFKLQNIKNNKCQRNLPLHLLRWSKEHHILDLALLIMVEISCTLVIARNVYLSHNLRWSSCQTRRNEFRHVELFGYLLSCCDYYCQHQADRFYLID